MQKAAYAGSVNCSKQYAASSMDMKKIYLIFPIILIDRVIKYLASSINLGGGFVKIGLYKNYSGAFSLPIAGTVYNALGVLLLFIFIFLFISETKKTKSATVVSDLVNRKFAYSLIILGGASNIFDRLYFGYVIDYAQVMNWSFFNLADGMLIGGVGILIAGQLKKIQNSPNLPKA